MIAITLDTDWAPVELVRESIEMIRGAGCAVTVFCTNPMDIEADELALHPNVTSLDDLAAPFAELKAAYPQARGFRSHRLFFTEQFRDLYDRFDLTYDANAIQYLCPHLGPSPIGTRTVSIPLFFMDRFHMEMSAHRADRWSLSSLPMDQPGLQVFDFHPVHLALNTPDVAWYERAKPHYHDADRLRASAWSGPGQLQTLLEELLAWIGTSRLETVTCAQIEHRYRSAHPQETCDARDPAR